MRANIDDIQRQLTLAASNCVSEAEAAYFAGLSVNTHLRKAPRMNPLQEALDDIQKWQELRGKNIQAITDRESILLLDFNGLPPAIKIKYIHDELEKRARRNGMAAVGFRNSNGVITLNSWSAGLAARDLIGISMFNGGTGCSVPHGAKTGVLGTNPIAYAIPTQTSPIILDMATTEIPFFEVKNARERNLPLPANSALDRDGKRTKRAGEALTGDGVANLLPLGGGFKGYGILMLIEILTGPLVQSLLSTRQTSGWNPSEYGCLIIAIDIASFTDPDSFKQSVSDMCDRIRSLPPAQGFDAVQIPGDRGNRRVMERMATGEMEIDKELIEKLHCAIAASKA